MQGFNQYVRSDMCESMVELYRIHAEIDRRKLLFLRILCSLAPSAAALQIFLYKLFMCTDSRNHDSGFIADIFQTLIKYNLQHYLITYTDKLEFPSKSKWKRIINKSVFEYERSQWEHRVSNGSDCDRFKILHSKISAASL